MLKLIRPIWDSFFILALVLVLFTFGARVHAEQKQRLGAYDVHYVVVPSTFFNKEIAERYGIDRGRDRALINVSVLNQDQIAVPVSLEGDMANLLGQRQTLVFREVSEGTAIYYLAPIRHADRETLRFSIRITDADNITEELKFQQQMFWDGR